MNDDDLNSLTERIIGSAFKVLNALGTGFVEEVYHNALVYELKKGGLIAARNKRIVKNPAVQIHSMRCSSMETMVAVFAASVERS